MPFVAPSSMHLEDLEALNLEAPDRLQLAVERWELCDQGERSGRVNGHITQPFKSGRTLGPHELRVLLDEFPTLGSRPS